MQLDPTRFARAARIVNPVSDPSRVRFDVERLPLQERQVLPAMVIHRTFIFGVRPEREYVERVVDEIVLPACRAETVR